MDLYQEAKEIIIKAGEQVLERNGIEEIKEKGKADYVTAVDFQVQQLIFKKLLELDDSIQFLGEEKDNEEIDFHKNIWILDPVDGTTNLIHDFQHSVISLAYYEQGKVQFGIVYNPFSKELFEAKLGEGAYRNGEKIKVSQNENLSECLIGMGTAPTYRQNADTNFKRMRNVYDGCQDIRRIGSTALELCYVACGRLDGFFEENLKIWDYAAGKLLVQEAGGQVEILKNKVIASNPAIMEAFKKIVME